MQWRPTGDTLPLEYTPCLSDLVRAAEGAWRGVTRTLMGETLCTTHLVISQLEVALILSSPLEPSLKAWGNNVTRQEGEGLPEETSAAH